MKARLFLLAAAFLSTPALAGDADDLAKRYSRGNYALYFLANCWGFAVLGLILLAGLGPKFRSWAEKVSRGPNRVVFFTSAILTVALALAELPLRFYRGYLREKSYGFARQGVLGWLGDWAKGLAIGVVLGGLFFVALYAVVRKFPKRYWLVAAVVAIVFLVIAVAVEPVFLAPLFNRFTPLPPGPLKTRLLDLAHSHGIPAKDVFEVDASRQSAHTNAYVSGLLGTQRIVIYDTLLKTETAREVVATMGHEMGHYVLHHVWKGLALASLGVLAVCGLVALLYPRLTRLPISDPAGLPLVVLLVSLLSFLSTPIGDGYSRRIEHEADAFGLDVTRDPDAAESSLRKFNTIDLSEYDPPRFVEWWYYTHPSLRHRIEFCEQWKREHGYDSKP